MTRQQNQGLARNISLQLCFLAVCFCLLAVTVSLEDLQL